jgi:amino acid transporter
MSSTPLTRPSAAEPEPALAGGQLSSGVLGTSDIVFMVMAAAAPMGVVVMLMPMAFAFGNGGGVPGTYLGAIAALLLFAIGYVRIIPFVQNAGAFYAYIAAGVGRTWGLAAAYIAAFSYFALSASTLAAMSYFCELFFERYTGLKLHWSVWALGALLLVFWLSYHRITLAAKVLGFALAAEVALILLLDCAIVAHTGWQRLDLGAFTPERVIAPGLGVAAIYAFNGVLGVEGTAIYQEEARRREVTVPRATYIAVVLVGLFYVFTAWCLTMAVGADRISTVAKSDLGVFVIDQTLAHLGTWGADAVSLLVLTSAFAAGLGLFNNSARYLYALGRDGVLPRALAQVHPRHRSPHIAALVLTTAIVIVFVLAVLAGLDPLTNVSTALVGVGSVGLMALLAITALTIPIFFARRRMFGFAVTVAPVVGGLVIAAATVLAFLNYSVLTGVDSVVINRLPYVLIALAAFGTCQARWLQWKNPALYLRIASTRVDEERGATAAPNAS